MVKPPDWMSENEWKDQLRREHSQMMYDIYNAPEWVKKGSAIVAALILLTLVVGLLILFISAIGKAILS